MTRVLALGLSLILCLFCFGCGRPTNINHIRATSLSGEHISIPYKTKAVVNPYYTRFPGDDEISVFYNIVNGMSGDQIQYAAEVFDDKYLVITMLKAGENKADYFLLMKCNDDPKNSPNPRYPNRNDYILWNSNAALFDGEYFTTELLLPFHLMPELGLSNVCVYTQDSSMNLEPIEECRAYKIKGTKQDFEDFYSKAKDYEIMHSTEDSFVLNGMYEFIFTDQLTVSYLIQPL